MASQTIDVIYNVTGQSLYFDAPEGRPSSVTSSTVYETSSGDDGTAESATAGSAAVETNPNTTFDAASGQGQADERKCSLAATTGISVDRVYLATSATGEREWVAVTAIAGADHVIAREPLANAYASADTFVSTRITHAVDPTWVAEKSNISGEFNPNPRYRWRLVYVVSSVTHVHDLYFDLVRYAARHDVRPTDVDMLAPGWMQRVGTFHREDQGRGLIDEAHRSVKFDFFNLGVPDQSIRNREVINELVKLKAIALVDVSDVTEGRYQTRLSQLIANAKAAVQTDSTGAGGQADRAPVWRR